MATEITKAAATNVAMPEPKNAFEAYGDSGGTRILGEMLKFSKGEWVHGRDNREMKEGLKLIAGTNLIEVGWILWQEGRPSDVVMGRVGEGFVMPRRAELGFLNTLEWPRSEMDSDYGKPRDPWQKASAMPLVDQGGTVYTFVTGSKGGEGALKELARVYGKRMRTHPDELPIITLAMESYRHANKQLGKIWVPVFAIAGWTAEKRLTKALAKAEMTAHEEREDESLEPEPEKNAHAAAKGHGQDRDKTQPKAKAIADDLRAGSFTGKPPNKDYPPAKQPEPQYAGEDDDDIPF
jgi:hypothetical protein